MGFVRALQNNYTTFTVYLKGTTPYKMILYLMYKKTFYVQKKKKKKMTGTLEAMTDLLGKLVCKDRQRKRSETREDEE